MINRLTKIEPTPQFLHMINDVTQISCTKLLFLNFMLCLWLINVEDQSFTTNVHVLSYYFLTLCADFNGGEH